MMAQSVCALEPASQELRPNERWSVQQQRGIAACGGSPQGSCEPTEVLFAAVAHDGFALRFATEGLKADRDISPFAAVAQNGIALEFASVELRANHEVVVRPWRRIAARPLRLKGAASRPKELSFRLWRRMAARSRLKFAS